MSIFGHTLYYTAPKHISVSEHSRNPKPNNHEPSKPFVSLNNFSLKLKSDASLTINNFLEREIGIKFSHESLTIELLSKKFFLHHGDGIDTSDKGYLLLRKILRSKINIWLYKLIHPDFGALNFIIRTAGGEPLNFLGTTALALPTIATVEIWRGVGFWAVFFLAALIGLPDELYEAAHLDGTSAWQRFVYITVPLLRPTILFALVLATIYNLQIFDTVFVMTDGGPANSTATIVWYIYRTLFTYGNVGYGATLSFVLLIVILILTLILMRLLRGRKVN